jgi:hypothetical protein
MMSRLIKKKTEIYSLSIDRIYAFALDNGQQAQRRAAWFFTPRSQAETKFLETLR